MPAFKDRDIVSFYFDGEKKTGEILDVASKSLLVCWVQKNKKNFCSVNKEQLTESVK